MFCPVCGSESAQGLNYCKRCGAALGGLNDDSIKVSHGTGTLGWVLAFLTILIGLGGLFGVFASAIAFRQPGIEDDLPIILIIFGSLSVCGVVAMLVHMVLRLAALGEKPKSQRARVEPPIQRAETQISSAPAVVSVTEHTTRTFEPAEKEVGVRD